MAVTAEGAALTSAHRATQGRIQAAALAQLAGMWGSFQPEAVLASWAALEPAVITIISGGRQLSAAAAAQYYRQFRAVEGIAGAAPEVALDAVAWRPAASVSVEVTGPRTALRLATLNRPDVAAQTLVRLSGTVGRFVSDAGREQITTMAAAESIEVGWARVTAGNPCAFCAMLASRGPVYSRESGDFQAHDHDRCTLEPVFRRDQPWPGRAREFREIWNRTTAGARDSDEARLLFRRAIEGRG